MSILDDLVPVLRQSDETRNKTITYTDELIILKDRLQQLHDTLCSDGLYYAAGCMQQYIAEVESLKENENTRLKVLEIKKRAIESNKNDGK